MMNRARRALLACVMLLYATSGAQAFAVSTAPRQRAPAALRSHVPTASDLCLFPSRGCGFRALGMALPGIMLGAGPGELLSRLAEVCRCLALETMCSVALHAHE
jgi:hypothetical protein